MTTYAAQADYDAVMDELAALRRAEDDRRREHAGELRRLEARKHETYAALMRAKAAARKS